MGQITSALRHASPPIRSSDEHERIVKKRLDELAFCETQEVLHKLQTRTSGLTEAEVQACFETYGPNEVVREKRLSPLRRLYNVGKNPLVVLLSVLAVISIAAGDNRAAIIISVMVLLGVALRYFQEARADGAAEKLAPW